MAWASPDRSACAIPPRSTGTNNARASATKSCGFEETTDCHVAQRTLNTQRTQKTPFGSKENFVQACDVLWLLRCWCRFCLARSVCCSSRRPLPRPSWRHHELGPLSRSGQCVYFATHVDGDGARQCLWADSNGLSDSAVADTHGRPSRGRGREQFWPRRPRGGGVGHAAQLVGR